MQAPVRLWILICNPENRRHDYFADAVPIGEPLVVMSYIELLTTPDLRALLHQRLLPFISPCDVRNAAQDGFNLRCRAEQCQIKPQQINPQQIKQWQIKIDSAGENFDVEKALLCRSASQYHNLSEDRGHFYGLDHWFAGFRDFLGELDSALQSLAKAQQATVNYLNTPEAIIAMTDKWHCQQALAQQGIAVPALYPQSLTAADRFETLRRWMLSEKRYQVFIKPRFGSSASGVVALRLHPDGERMIARTSLEIDAGGKFYNSLKIRAYQARAQIESLFDAIVAQQGYVETWLPKPTLNGFSFDLRMVVIKGVAAHYVTRCSRSPMTNLHLGNQRGDILAHPKGEIWLAQARAIAERAAKAIDGAGCVGADILVGPAGCYVLELNAFGDLLPRIEHQGQTSYQRQVTAMMRSSSNDT
uniref:STM4014 family protein n=1 Tax=Thaumasiovibrio occultus TaxID=1891184 RepID=UPI000B353611|nr:STM4014 family protein [Thaumasiovibrio occultus]